MKVKVRETSTLHQEVFTSTNRGGKTITTKSKRLRLPGEEMTISPREFEIYKHLLEVIELEEGEEHYQSYLVQSPPPSAKQTKTTTTTKGE